MKIKRGERDVRNKERLLYRDKVWRAGSALLGCVKNDLNYI